MDEMVTIYGKYAGAHKYLVGFIRGGIVYYVLVSFRELFAFLKLDRASSKKGGHAKIRVRVSSTQAAQLFYSGKAVELCNESELNADSKHNKGENFERIVTEKLTGELWVKDSIPFYVKGDITLNGEEVQVKLDGAELTNEKTLAKTVEILANA
jgi:hypothetical protein